MGNRLPHRQPDGTLRVWRTQDPGGNPWAPGQGAPDAESQAPGRAVVHSLLSPRYYPPPGAGTIRALGRNAGQVLADGEVELATSELLEGNVGVIRVATFSVNGLLVSSDITFRIRVGGELIEGWEWSPFPSAVSAFVKEFPPDVTLIELGDAVTVAVTAEVDDVGTYDLGADLQGWYYARELRDSFDRVWWG